MERLAHNYRNLRALTPMGTKFLGLVKADAYGHGAVPIARELEKLGADYLGVACLDEAIELREAGITAPILILGCTPLEYAGDMSNPHKRIISKTRDVILYLGMLWSFEIKNRKSITFISSYKGLRSGR